MLVKALHSPYVFLCFCQGPTGDSPAIMKSEEVTKDISLHLLSLSPLMRTKSTESFVRKQRISRTRADSRGLGRDEKRRKVL